jgi:DNA-binding response OmpR family regulator
MIRPYSILIAVEDEGDRAVLAARLDELGCRVALADDAAAAVEIVERQAVDLVLLAVEHVNGESDAATRRLTAAAAAREIPILGLAGAGHLETTGAGRPPVDDYLIKPLHPTVLDARVETFRRFKQVCEELLEQRGRIGQLERRVEALVKAVIPIGVNLLATPDFGRLLETILLEAKALCRADGGTLYLRTEDDHLRFVILHTDSLGLAMGGSSGVDITFPPLPLIDPVSGAANHRNVATHVALTGESVNIADAYRAEGFEFSGTIAFDQRTGYRSMSFLTVPLKNAGGRAIGVLQLLNATDPETGAVVPFDAGLVPLVESLSTLAAAALEVYMREERMRREIRELHIQIDEAKRARQVAEITDTDYFRTLQQKARKMRDRSE